MAEKSEAEEDDAKRMESESTFTQRLIPITGLMKERALCIHCEMNLGKYSLFAWFPLLVRQTLISCKARKTLAI